MDFNAFDHEISKVLDSLRELLDAGAGFGLLQIFGHIATSSDEIKLIVERIEVELHAHNELTEEFFSQLSKGLEPDPSMINEMVRTWSFLVLDFKSFVIFSRIFCDSLCRLIRFTYGRVGLQLPISMNGLLETEKGNEVDRDFFSGLREEMDWFPALREDRVDLEHYLGGVRSTKTREGHLGFDILGLRDKGRAWGTDTVKSYTDFMEETIQSLTKVIRYISKKRL